MRVQFDRVRRPARETRRRPAHLRGVICLAVCLGGCVPVALPPAQTRLSGGATTEPRGIAEWRGGLYPAQLVPAAFERNWMAGGGYVGRTGGLLGLGHGVYGEIGYVHTRRIDDERIRRVSLTLAPEVIKRPDFDEWSRGATVTLAWDGVTAVNRSKTGVDRFIALASHGEGGIGAQLSLSVERYAERTLYLGMVGVRLTIPALAGVLFAPEILRGLAR